MPRMVLAGLFAAFLFLTLIIGDWIYFTSLTEAASRYGCRVARREDRLPLISGEPNLRHFDKRGLCRLPHGVARLFEQQRVIVLRPQYRLFSLCFRTAWPMKSTIELDPDGAAIRVSCAKRIPWSSAVLTLAWFGLVGIGTLGFLVAFGLNGGFATLSGVLMGAGIAGLGGLVVVFGLLVVSAAYRLEDHRLMQTYQELLEALAGSPGSMT